MFYDVARLIMFHTSLPMPSTHDEAMPSLAFGAPYATVSGRKMPSCPASPEPLHQRVVFFSEPLYAMLAMISATIADGAYLPPWPRSGRAVD